MLTHYLKSANETLIKLIEITRADIEDVKQVKHDSFFARNKIKEEFVQDFAHQKSLADNELVKLSEANPTKQIQELLDDEQSELLDELRENLTILHQENKRLASIVISVSEFYNSLLNRLVPSEKIGYGNKYNRKESQYLHLEG
jgi:hypothetical protein